MNILLATDDNYILPTGVLMHSIGMNDTNHVCFYVIVQDSVLESSKKRLRDIALKYNNEIEFCIVSNQLLKSLPWGRPNMPKHVSIATYYRLFITYLLPSHIHKIIYLDSDMLVKKPLTELWNTDVDGFALAAAHDQDEVEHLRLDYLSYPMKEYGYFNAGMLVINVDYWREHSSISRFNEYIQTHNNEIIYHDQDILNAVFYCEKKWAPLKYNSQDEFFCKGIMEKTPENLQQELYLAQIDPTIVHFSCRIKPWKIACYHPLAEEWRQVAQAGGEGRLRERGGMWQILKEKFKCAMLRWGILNGKYLYHFN